MKDVSRLIANLSPDQRAEFMRKLKLANKSKSSSGVEIPEPEETPVVVEEKYIPQPGDNYYCHMEKPGNFNSIVLRKKGILPPAPDHVQIKVKAASLNFRDLMIAMNMYMDTPGVPTVMGSDFSGVITAVGENVQEYKVGDEVFCLSAGSLFNNGSMDENSHFAAYTNITTNQLTFKPSNITWAEAACIPTVFLTSYFALYHKAKIKNGDKVLIHTASGGVGLSAIQIARWLGAKIFVTAGTEAKRAYLRSIGFPKPMDSRSLSFAREIMDRTHGEGIDIILNTLAGQAAMEGLKILKNFGHFLQIDKNDIAQNKKLELGEFKKGLTFSAIDLGLFYLHPDLMRKQLAEISRHFENRNFTPLKYTSYRIEELGMALSHLSRSQHIGKLVLEYDT